jgi:hypothetical protein
MTDLNEMRRQAEEFERQEAERMRIREKEDAALAVLLALLIAGAILVIGL